MALTAGTIWEIRAGATTANVNGAGFNIANANAVTDLTTDANTANTNSPVVSSATYTFVAGDASAWLYIVSGTNWTPGWYQIASVSGGKATLSAAVGQAIQRDTTIYPIKYSTNTVAGCATVGTPTSGTFLIDYSQQNAAQATNTNLTCTAGSTTVTSASAPFTRMMVGNIIHLTALTGTGASVGWYEIVSFTDTSNIVLDRTPTNGVNNITAGTFYVGGAGRLNGLEDAFFEMIPASSYVWIGTGSYTLSGSINISSTNSTTNAQSHIIGYNTLRGDSPTGSTRPTLVGGANTTTFGNFQNLYYLNLTTTSSSGWAVNSSSTIMGWCKAVNTSTASLRVAFANGTFLYCEGISRKGTAFSGIGVYSIGNLARDSATGFSSGNASIFLAYNVAHACDTAGFSFSASSPNTYMVNNTVYGNAGKNNTDGIKWSSASSSGIRIANNHIGGFVRGINLNGTQQSSVGWYNNFYNNTTDVVSWAKDKTDLAVNPGFTDVSEISGTTGQATTNVLTQSGGDFSTVEDGVDYLHVISGTGGGGVNLNRYLINSHTATTVTVEDNIMVSGTSNADIVYYIPTGHDLTPGTNLKAVGAPGIFPGAYCTGYLDIGAVQRAEPAAGASSSGWYGGE